MTPEQAEAALGPAAAYTAGGREESVLSELSGARGTEESIAANLGLSEAHVHTALLTCLVEGYVTSLPGGLWEITTDGSNALPA